MDPNMIGFAVGLAIGVVVEALLCDCILGRRRRNAQAGQQDNKP